MSICYNFLLKQYRSLLFYVLVLCLGPACSITSAPDKPRFLQSRLGSCSDYSKPVKKIQGYHYFDEGIHLSPYYKGAPAQLQGLVVLSVKDGSLYQEVGLSSGDILMEIDGEPTNKAVAELAHLFKRVKENSFDNIKFLRCSQMESVNKTIFKGP